MQLYIEYIKNINYENLFFTFLFYNSKTMKLDENALFKKVFPIINFVDKIIFNFHSFNKINDFVTTQSSNNLSSWS